MGPWAFLEGWILEKEQTPLSCRPCRSFTVKLIRDENTNEKLDFILNSSLYMSFIDRVISPFSRPSDVVTSSLSLPRCEPH